MTTKFGVEIECVGWEGSMSQAASVLARDARFNIFNEGYNSGITSNSWRVVREYSLSNGVEIISPPLPFTPDGLEHFASMLRHVRDNGGYMDERCGMHVHVDASFLHGLHYNERELFFNFLLSAYRNNEALFDACVKPNRRGNRNWYCKSLVGKTISDVYGDREHKLNINSFRRHGTIEFRHYHGTLNDQAAVAWVTLCTTFLKNVAKAFSITNNISLGA